MLNTHWNESLPLGYLKNCSYTSSLIDNCGSQSRTQFCYRSYWLATFCGRNKRAGGFYSTGQASVGKSLVVFLCASRGTASWLASVRCWHSSAKNHRLRYAHCRPIDFGLEKPFHAAYHRIFHRFLRCASAAWASHSILGRVARPRRFSGKCFGVAPHCSLSSCYTEKSNPNSYS